MSLIPNPIDAAVGEVVLTCACPLCRFCRLIWQTATPEMGDLIKAAAGGAPLDQLKQIGQKLAPEVDAEALMEAAKTCPCTFCASCLELHDTPDHGLGACREMAAEISDDSTLASVMETIRAHPAEPQN